MTNPTITRERTGESEKLVNGDGGAEDIKGSLVLAKPSPSRILRYAEVFDLRTYSTKLVKAGKPDKKLDKKKPVLVERRIINHKGQHTHTEVDVKSLALRDILIELNKDVEGLSLKKEPPLADPSLFFHSRSALKDRLSQEESRESPDSSIIADVTVALQYVEEEHGSNIASLERMLPDNEITWKLLWALFTPNTMMYHFHEFTEQPQILLMRSMKVKYRRDGSPYWLILCDMIADDGLKFGYTKTLGIASKPTDYTDLEIDQFDGARKIQDLLVYPLTYAPNSAQIKADVIARGQKYVRMVGHTFWETSGPALKEIINERYEVDRSKFTTHGRAVIDATSFRSWNPRWACIPTVHSTLDRNKLTDEQLMLCAPYAGGFGFGDKKWGGFPVSRLREVVWSNDPFDSLVIGSKQKNLIHSLVKQHSSNPTGYDDIIQGKGRGLIGLLSGNPGCGKTLTAEAVSEVTKRPLYPVSAGELGTEPEKVDQQLTSILEISHKWSAILLLDEADVFLQERDAKDVARNALVSIFLRQLEYYQGILILTTNRIANCDPAFESRIHFSIHYPDLDVSARKRIWKTFIEKAHASVGTTSKISDEDIDILAKHEMNGRQIKHTVGSARSIARENLQTLDVTHIESVLEVVEAWNVAKEWK
ncbi:hypothetical protein N7G274_009545 [Stereocaulon virgatum]|uniref:AAA+ ATPase domain-containing protein n=1 Tax=Stereocaulon virgatum TaxID=373712 RepID=A0ABR3ZW42_9LECA